MSETAKSKSRPEWISLWPIFAIASAPMMTSRMRLPSCKTSVTRTAPYEHSGIAATFGPNLAGNLGYESGVLEVLTVDEA